MKNNPRNLPLSVLMGHWLQELRPNATAQEYIDCCIYLLGKVYNRHKEENTELLKVQDILEAIASRAASPQKG